MTAGPKNTVDISVICGLLADRLDALCRTILPKGWRDGHEWVALNPTRADKTPGSFRIHLDGPRAGVWADFATPDNGDALDLVAYVLCGGNKAEAVKWAKGWLGIEDMDPAARVRAEASIARQKAVRKKEAAAADSKKQANAMRIWLGGAEHLRDTPAASYLAGRGIDLARLGRQPRALRFHPKLWNRESNSHWPALVAGVVSRKGKITAVHRTWLHEEPGGSVIKAPLKEPKMSLGRVVGGSIRVWRGASGKPLKAAPDDDRVAITEGLEDALTVALAMPDLRVLCAVSLANMANIELPDTIKSVLICGDNDEGKQAQAQLQRAVDRYLTEGRTVTVARSPRGKDFNDLLRWEG